MPCSNEEGNPPVSPEELYWQRFARWLEERMDHAFLDQLQGLPEKREEAEKD